MYIVKHIFKLAAALLLATICSCEELSRVESQIEDLEIRIANLEKAITAINNNTISVNALLKQGLTIIGVSKNDIGYTLELSDGRSIEIVDGINAPGIMPIIGVNEELEWIVSLDNGATFDKIDCGTATPEAAMTPQVRVNSEGYWEISTDKGNSWEIMRDSDRLPISAVDPKEIAGIKTFFTSFTYNETSGLVDITLADGRSLSINVEDSFCFNIIGHSQGESILPGETLSFCIETNDVADVTIIVPDGWRGTYIDDTLHITSPDFGEKSTVEVTLIVVSNKGYLKYIRLLFTLEPVPVEAGIVKEWEDYVYGRESNVLLNFSYAGYRYGEVAPANVRQLGYKIYNVTMPKYGAVPNDGKSDREAFLRALKDALGTPETDNNNCITFPHKPQAEAIIYFPAGEYILHSEEDNINDISQSIIIRAGHFAIVGDGRDLTRLVMESPMLPTDPGILYSSPDMIQLKHNSGISTYKLTTVSEDAAKGAFSVTVSSASSLNPGEWVCLYTKSLNPELLEEELAPYQANPNWDISKSGVEIIDYHKIKSIKGNVVTFHEPLHHEVKAAYDWGIYSYPHYEQVGVEDLTFVGHAKEDFQHHGSWEDDGAYKPLSFNRVTDSWIRRVGFESTSEGCSIINSANVSAYDIVMTGNRGHAAVRSQASSRVLIAATRDDSSDGAGNWHGVGVSRQSIGTVLWRNRWGDESCFESHSSQPRATLIDCCSGGWHREHQGGDSNLAPNHLADLTIWNFHATEVSETDFIWWGTEAEPWWKFLPPIIVGFQSETPVTFNTEDTKVISSHNHKAEPESLYEAQLQQRLGYLPGWLNELK